MLVSMPSLCRWEMGAAKRGLKPHGTERFRKHRGAWESREQPPEPSLPLSVTNPHSLWHLLLLSRC